MRVVRELTESRSKLVCARTNLAEKLAEMQHEYMRLMRVADLSRVVSKENVAKTAKVMKTLKQVSIYCEQACHASSCSFTVFRGRTCLMLLLLNIRIVWSDMLLH